MARRRSCQNLEYFLLIADCTISAPASLGQDKTVVTSTPSLVLHVQKFKKGPLLDNVRESRARSQVRSIQWLGDEMAWREPAMGTTRPGTATARLTKDSLLSLRAHTYSYPAFLPFAVVARPKPQMVGSHQAARRDLGCGANNLRLRGSRGSHPGRSRDGGPGGKRVAAFNAAS